MIRSVIPAIAVAAVSAVTAASAAAQNVTITNLGPPTMLGRVSIVEPVTVSCSGFDPSLTMESESVTVTVAQASGRKIAHGSGTGGGFYPDLPFACDGSENTVPVTITMDPTGPPLRGGSAVFTASAGASAATLCSFGGSLAFCPPFETAGDSAGPVTEHLH